MKSPITGNVMSLHKESGKLLFRKEEFEIIYHYYLCEDSGEMFEDEFTLNMNMLQVHNKYRELHKLPFVIEIKQTREKYGVSAVKMSEILGFGVNTYRSYEAGEVPSDANGKLIQLASIPGEFERLVRLCGKLTNVEADKIIKRIESQKPNEVCPCESGLSDMRVGSPSIFNGYKRLDIDSAFTLLAYFALKLKPWKTHLNKLLFYSDFIHYSRVGASITGLQYKAIPRGPAPDFHETLFELAESRGYVRKEYKTLGNGHDGEVFHSVKGKSIDIDLLSNEAMGVIAEVMEKYGHLSVKDIVDLSHDEIGWKKNKTNCSKISYEYSYDIRIPESIKK